MLPYGDDALRAKVRELEARIIALEAAVNARATSTVPHR